jgi:hypothetical protein
MFSQDHVMFSENTVVFPENHGRKSQNHVMFWENLVMSSQNHGTFFKDHVTFSQDHGQVIVNVYVPPTSNSTYLLCHRGATCFGWTAACMAG